jgi:hypothetical protein
MNVPRFTAEASLYKTGRHYQARSHAINSSTQEIGTLHLAAINVPGEVIEVEGEAPWGLPWGWGPGGWGDGGSGTWGGTGGSSDGGGGGGAGGPAPRHDPAIETGLCPRGPNPDYDRTICEQCLEECAIAHPIIPCQGSKLWCNAINADPLRERDECNHNTCGWRCELCA